MRSDHVRARRVKELNYDYDSNMNDRMVGENDFDVLPHLTKLEQLTASAPFNLNDELALRRVIADDSLPCLKEC